MKQPNSIQNPDDPIIIPKKLHSESVDYECELAVIIGRKGRRVKKEDVEIERSFLEVSSSNYDISNIPDHINYLPRKQAAVYLGISESTLTRYHVKGKLKWITRRNRTPIYKRETLDHFKDKNKGKLLS